MWHPASRQVEVFWLQAGISNNQQWWCIRREGDGTLPPTQIPGNDPPSDLAVREGLENESLFEVNHQLTLAPTCDGFPDVDTYREFEFYIYSRAAGFVKALAQGACGFKPGVGVASRSLPRDIPIVFPTTPKVLRPCDGKVRTPDSTLSGLSEPFHGITRGSLRFSPATPGLNP